MGSKNRLRHLARFTLFFVASLLSVSAEEYGNNGCKNLYCKGLFEEVNNCEEFDQNFWEKLKLWTDFTYQKWCQQLLVNLIDHDSDVGATPVDKLSFMEHDFNLGFRIGAVFSTSLCGNGFWIEWTRFHSAASHQNRSGTGNPLDPAIQGLELEAAENESLLFVDRFTYNKVDIATDLFAWDMGCSVFTIYGGVRWVDLERCTEEKTILSGATTAACYYDLELRGIGPYLSLSASRSFGCDFSLSGHLGASALCSQVDTIRSVNSDTNVKVASRLLEDHDRAIASLDAALRIHYQFCIYGIRGSAHLGFETTYWNSLGHVERGKTPFSGAANANPMGLFEKTDVTIYGFTGGLFYGF